MKNIVKNNFAFNLLFFSLLSLGQLQRIEVTSQLSIYLHELVIGIYLLYLWLKHQLIWPSVFTWSKATKLFFSWLIITLIFHSVFSQNNFIVSILYYGRWFTYYLFALNLAQQQKPSQLLKWLLSSGLLFCFWGLLQYCLLPDLRFLKVLGWDDHFYRLTSTQLDPNFAGLLTIFTFICLLFSQLKIKPIFITIIKGFTLLALAFTFSRASFLSFLVLILSLEIIRIKKLIKIPTSYPAFIFLLLAILISQILLKTQNIGGEGIKLNRTSTITARLTDSQLSLRNLNPSQWLIGRGLINQQILYTETQFINHSKFPNNLFLLILQTSGLIGVSLFLFSFKNIIAKIYQEKIVFLPILLATITHSMFNHSLLQNFIFLWLNLLWYTLPKNQKFKV